MIQLSDLPGLGKKRLEALRNAGINSVGRLILTLPGSYQDMTQSTPIADVPLGADVCVTGYILREPRLSHFRGLSCVTCVLSDDTGKLNLQWYNQPWMKDQLSTEGEITLFGRVNLNKQGKPVMNSGRIVTEAILQPVYSPIKQLPGKTLREVIRCALEHVEECLPETLPEDVRIRHHLCERNFALRQAHFPENGEMLKIALRRLSFEALLMYQTATKVCRRERGLALPLSLPGATDEFLSSLPFPPTNAQRRVLDEISKDLSSGIQMNRMVQGDVGCGKTAVAFACLYLCARCGHQGILMAPTEILARQHLESAQKMLEPLGIKCGLMLGGMKAKEKKAALESISKGEWQVVIGTHALLGKDIAYRDPALVITDEQHRFGVLQRGKLLRQDQESALSPHALVMSATPIPRSLSLVLMGDLELSVIDEMPLGRRRVETRLVPEEKREAMYGFLVNSCKAGRQAYIVCPLVEESETLDAASARETYIALSTGPLRELRLGLTWGAQPEKEKEETLRAFTAGEIQVLVSTTVVEVGVNVPNATVMVIENAERFGLSQLHQLRGRVGRGSEQSWCFLMARKNERLQVLCDTDDGFRIAEKDLELRGPGDYLGTRQHGEMLPGMQFTTDMELLRETGDCLKYLEKEAPEESRELVKKSAAEQFRELTESIVMN